MECYGESKMIKTFRGLIADEAQDTIVLHTNDGSTGYRIIKLQLMPENPTSEDYEGVVKIWSTEQTAPHTDATIDFSNNELLGIGTYSQDKNTNYYSDDVIVIFDNMTFNQDIYITYLNAATSTAAMNYYLELEQVKLDLSESTVATLKNIRNEKRIAPG